MEHDENVKLTLPGGRVAGASLVRDPTTDVAVLRFQPDGLPVATTAGASLRAGQVVVAVGNHDGAPLAALGIVALASGAWHSVRGGTIDSLLRLDLALSPAAEGGALVDLQGRVIGMTVLGPSRRALSIPSSTVDRAVDQLLVRGYVFRGYLGAGLQPMKQERASQSSGSGRGVLVVSIDPNGPERRRMRLSQHSRASAVSDTVTLRREVFDGLVWRLEALEGVLNDRARRHPGDRFLNDDGRDQRHNREHDRQHVEARVNHDRHSR